jgi:hypothetical protein
MMNTLSEVFRAEHRPDEINQHQGGNAAAHNKIEHFYTFSQAGT